jgi:hypothetical protein
MKGLLLQQVFCFVQFRRSRNSTDTTISFFFLVGWKGGVRGTYASTEERTPIAASFFNFVVPEIVPIRQFPFFFGWLEGTYVRWRDRQTARKLHLRFASQNFEFQIGNHTNRKCNKSLIIVYIRPYRQIKLCHLLTAY